VAAKAFELLSIGQEFWLYCHKSAVGKTHKLKWIYLSFWPTGWWTFSSIPTSCFSCQERAFWIPILLQTLLLHQVTIQ